MRYILADMTSGEKIVKDFYHYFFFLLVVVTTQQMSGLGVKWKYVGYFNEYMLALLVCTLQLIYPCNVAK